MVERWTETPEAAGSVPAPSTNKIYFCRLVFEVGVYNMERDKKDLLKSLDRQVAEAFIEWVRWPSPFTVLMKAMKDKEKQDKKHERYK